MASGQWQINNVGIANVIASASVTAGTTGGQAIRLRSFAVFLAGGQASANFVVRDGATGAGTVLFSGAVQGLTGTIAFAGLTGLDLRATSGAMTVEISTAGIGTNTLSAVNAQGDLIQIGAPVVP